MTKFPAPFWHEKDGGRFIGTGDIVITQEPGGGWVNLGTYRLQLHDRNHVGLSMAPTHHGHLHMQKWFARGEPMPVAVALGQDPLLFLVGSSEIPHGVCEYDYAGAIKGEPIEVMRGPITGLPIPAQAEIVIEGFVEPQDKRPEGPFGEFTGYYAGGIEPAPVIRVEGLYYRSSPIILGEPPLKPLTARVHYSQVLRAALFLDALEAAGIPDAVAAWPHVARSFFVVVAIRQRYPGHAKQAGRVASQCYLGGTMGRYTVVVDEDIDVTDLNEVLWAMCTRVDPQKDVEVLKGMGATRLDPVYPPEEKGLPVASALVIDATRPYEWRERFPQVVGSSAELRQQVLARWGDVLGT